MFESGAGPLATRSAPAPLFAQLAAVLFLAACAIPAPEADSQQRRLAPDLSRIEWIESPPPGCAVGASGPTLNPRHAIRNARLAAIEALAASRLEMTIQSITVSDSATSSGLEISTQTLSGQVANARIAALWADRDQVEGSRNWLRGVYALACWPEADLRDVSAVDYPSWLIEPPERPGQICATGVAGPTWKAVEQVDSALRDARFALAVSLESRIEKRVFDPGRGVARFARQVDPSPAATARAAAASSLERRWLDERGTGPMGLEGALYGLVCVEE